MTTPKTKTLVAIDPTCELGMATLVEALDAAGFSCYGGESNQDSNLGRIYRVRFHGARSTKAHAIAVGLGWSAHIEQGWGR